MARVVVVGGGLAGSASAVRLAKLGHEVTLVESRPDGRRRRRVRRAGRLPLGRRARRDRAAGGAARPLPQVRPPAGARARPRPGRPAARAPLRGRLPAVAALGQPRPPSSPRSTRRSAPAWASSGSTTSTTRPSRGTGCAATGSSAPTARAGAEGDRGAAAQPADAAQGRHAAASRTSGCALLAAHHAVQGGHDPRNVPAWFGLVDYLEQNFGTWTFPGGFGALAGLLTKRLGERRVTVLTSTTAQDIEMGAGRPDRRCAPTPARSTPTRSWSPSTRGGCPRSRRTSTRTMPAIPPDRHPPRPRPAGCPTCRARSSSTTSTSSPSAPTAPRRRARRPGRCSAGASCRRTSSSRSPARRSTSATPSRSASTGRRATLVEHYSGSPVGRAVAGPRHASRDRLGTVTPLPGVLRRGRAHRRRRLGAVRGAHRGARRRGDRPGLRTARPARGTARRQASRRSAGVRRRAAGGWRRSRASPWTG